MTVPWVDADLGAGLRFRRLTGKDAPLLVEATAAETAPALWGPSPPGPYTLTDATEALDEWSADQVSFGLLKGDRLLAAFGLMAEAEICYWTPPIHRRNGYAAIGLRFLAAWSHEQAGLEQVWLEIQPGNEASQRVAERAGFGFARRLADHCETWEAGRPTGARHDCLIFLHPAEPAA
jgi:RimJ/RimL family protein N-acetyltransferase